MAVVSMVAVAVSAGPGPVTLDSFDDPVNRGVYGPWHPVIRQQANQAFLRHHVFSGGMDSSVARARSRFGQMSNAKN